MKRVVSAGVLAMLIVGFAVYLPAHAQNPVAVSSSTLQSLTTETTLHATASHVVQPYGVYHELASGALYAANGVDNVSITMTSGFPSFSSYEANTTLAEWASGCQTDTAKQSGADLVLDYSGASCGIAPILKLAFSPLPTYNATANNCTLFWVHESYSWCGDAGFSYSAGVLTIVAPSATFNIDPMIIQTNSGHCSSCTSLSVTFSSHVTAGNSLYATVGIYYSTTPCPTVSVTDSYQTYSQIVDVAGGQACSYIFAISGGTSGADTVKESTGATSVNEAELGIIEANGYFATSSNTQTGECTSGCTGNLATGSLTFNSGNLELGSASSNAGGSFTPGSLFTSISDNAFCAGGQYSTTVSSPTTFPATCSGDSNWANVGADFQALYPETTLLTMTVNAPPGGAIVYSGTTYSTSTVLTFTSTSTWTVTAAAFASYIFDGWSGFACTDLVNPVQTCSITTISSYTTSSTVSSTLIASMSMNSSGASGKTILAAFVIVGIILMLCGMAWAVSKR